MIIRFLRTCSVPIRISSPELHVLDTCFSHELHIMERYVTTTYRSQKLNVFIQGGYLSSTYPKYIIDALNVSAQGAIVHKPRRRDATMGPGRTTTYVAVACFMVYIFTSRQCHYVFTNLATVIIGVMKTTLGQLPSSQSSSFKGH